MSILDHRRVAKKLRAQKEAGKTLEEALKIIFYDNTDEGCRVELIGAVEEVEGVSIKEAIRIVIELLKDEDEDVSEVMEAAYDLFDVE